MKRGSKTIPTVLVTVVVLGCLAAASGLAILYSGAISVAVITPDWPIVTRVLDTAKNRSVKAHARDVIVPADYKNIDIHAGHRRYNDMCVSCHGAPGVERSWVGEGLNPYPPSLEVTANHWTAAETYWIVDHGIKMTGMPAMGPSHAEAEVWTVAAFVRSLPGLTPEQYKAFGSPAGDHGTTSEQPP
jgi:mono/diheme cytochrome c family protein